MNALPAETQFTVRTAPDVEWLVLLCGAQRTLALAAALVRFGAWTPTWKVSRQFPRSPARRRVTEPVIPGLVFVPAEVGTELPAIPRIPFRYMHNPADYRLTRVPERQMAGLRRIADKPLVKASQLPKPGQRVRFISGPWQGLTGRIITCTQRGAKVAMDNSTKSTQVWEVAPCMLLKI